MRYSTAADGLDHRYRLSVAAAWPVCGSSCAHNFLYFSVKNLRVRRAILRGSYKINHRLATLF